MTPDEAAAHRALLDRIMSRFEALPPRAPGPLSTDAILRVLEGLNRPQDRLAPVIHVAGTNGKGSTVAFLRALAEAQGLAVHVDTSPHLIRVNERIRLAGRLIEDDHLEALIERVLAANGGGTLSFYEGMTAAALLAFSEVPADLVVLETGLGGRFDSTNVVDQPAVSVITPIDFDHLDFFLKAPVHEDPLTQIAWEKAGIIKQGRPVVSAPQANRALAMIEAETHAKGASLKLLGRDAQVSGTDRNFTYRGERTVLADIPLALEGPHQVMNAGVALLALEQLKGMDQLHLHAPKGLKSADWPARMHRLSPGPVTERLGARAVWVDGGHNPHAARALARKFGEDGPVDLVCAMMASKDAAGFFHAFSGRDVRVFAGPMPPGFKGHEAAALAAFAHGAGLEAVPYDTIDQALDAVALAPDHRTTLICGSLYLAAMILGANGEVIS